MYMILVCSNDCVWFGGMYDYVNYVSLVVYK